MTAAADPSVHGSAVLVGERAVLIRGPSGAGKSRLAFDLMLAGLAGQIAPTRLIGDDRIRLSRAERGIVVQAVPELAGLIEVRGLGVRRCDHVAQGVLGLVVDLNAADAARLPPPESLEIAVLGLRIARIPIGEGFSALPPVLAALLTQPGPEREFSLQDRLLEGNC